MQVLLYTTLGCHLCEQALELAAPICRAAGLELVEVEIADSEALLARYGVRIPVLAIPGHEPDLGWPFDAATVDAWLVNAGGR